MSVFSRRESWGWEQTWASADWSWGYARGEAHDRAARIRSQLRRVEDRLQWQADEATPVGELLLGLALAVQRTENAGVSTALSSVVSDLAQGRIAHEEAACDALLAAMETTSAGLVNVPALGRIGELQSMGERRRAVLRAALDSVRFVDRGM